MEFLEVVSSVGYSKVQMQTAVVKKKQLMQIVAFSVSNTKRATLSVVNEMIVSLELITEVWLSC